MKLNKCTAVLLLPLILLTLCSCSGKNGNGCKRRGETDGIEGLKKVRPEHVYSVSYLEGTLAEGEYISDINAVGDKIYVSAYFSKPREIEGETAYESGVALYSMNLDGSDYKQIISFTDSETENEDGSTLYSSTTNLTPCPDGTFWFLSQETLSGPSENSYESSGRLVHASPDGTELNSIDTRELSRSPYFYISSMFLTRNNDLILASYDNFSVIDKQGTLKLSIPTNGAYITNLALTGNGEVIGIKNSYDTTTFVSSSTLVRLNDNTKAFDDIGSVPANNIQSFTGGEGSTVIINSGSSVYTYDTMSGELSELINWINSDINYSRVSNLTVLPEGKFIIAENSADYSSVALALLSQKPESEIAEKYVLTFASVYIDSNLQDALIKFNKQSDQYRIKYLDYSIYNTPEDSNAGVAKLNCEISSGQIPDLFSMSGLPYSTYASKGLLEDIGVMMSADPSFDKSLYLENILNASAFNGRICSIIPSFSVMTVAGKSENVGTELKWTMEDLQALVEKYPEAAVFAENSKSTILSHFNMMAMNSYIDEETRTCSFNTNSFYKVLEFAKSFPDEVDYGSNAVTRNKDTQYRNNEILLNILYMYGYSQIRDIVANFGSDFTFVGFPVPEGMGTSINPSLELAISSKSALKEVSWDFVKYLLSEEFQGSITYSFPIMKSRLDTMAQDAIINSTGSYTGGNNPNGAQVKPITQAQIDQINRTLTSVSSVQRSNNDILAIIEEEAGAYFANQQTARAAAEAIQSRVQDYLTE